MGLLPAVLQPRCRAAPPRRSAPPRWASRSLLAALRCAQLASPSAPLFQARLASVELASAKGLPAARGALAQARPNAIVGAGANGSIFTGAARRARRHVEPLLYFQTVILRDGGTHLV